MTHWNTPGGMAAASCLDMLEQPHLLIAGSTGSGKSVLLNSLIYTTLYKAPNEIALVLIDPKRVELVEFAGLPHCLRYASEPDEITETLYNLVELMETRFVRMRAERFKQSKERDIYIIIDEFADLMTTQKRETLPFLVRIAQLGRAANMHLIIATQRPTRDVVNGQIKVNIDSRVALRCPTAQDSRNIINTKGAEALPRFGYGYYLTPETVEPLLIQIPYTTPEELSKRVLWWVSQKQDSRKKHLKKWKNKVKLKKKGEKKTMKYREYDFKEIEEKALTDRTKDAIAELGKWYESNGNAFWNGEHYHGSYNGQEYRLTPIMKCVDEENEEWEQTGWELD